MREKYVICTNSGIKTIKSLISKMSDVVFVSISKPGPKRKVIYYKNGKIIDKKFLGDCLTINNSIIIRYGSAFPIKGEGNIVYNEPSNIILSSNKMKSRKEMTELKVSCPTVYDLKNRIRKFPLVVRPFKHSKGKDFTILKNPIELEVFKNNNPTGYYYSEFVKKEKEFRVHCAHGKILLIKEKPEPKDGNPIWNIDANGEAFVYIPWEEYNFPGMRDVCLQSLKATKALGLDFAAIDIMLRNNVAYVLEANTAPSLYTAEYTEGRYIKYFEYLFNLSKNQKLSHWDYSSFKEADSLAWKNNQLISNKNVIK